MYSFKGINQRTAAERQSGNDTKAEKIIQPHIHHDSHAETAASFGFY
jgi:hypothetical protein